jgi:hypothetical protein
MIEKMQGTGWLFEVDQCLMEVKYAIVVTHRPGTGKTKTNVTITMPTKHVHLESNTYLWLQIEDGRRLRVLVEINRVSGLLQFKANSPLI